MRTPDEILHQVFGFPSFRGLQGGIIADVCAGRDVLAIMPTGAGKSLCYQVPALVRPGVAIVVSPLIALMADQVRSLRAYGVPRGDAQQHVRRRRGDGRGPARRRARPAVRRPRARQPAGVPRTGRPDRGRPGRDRRGALRQPVGPRLPARIPPAPRLLRRPARRAARRADGDRGPGDAARHPRPARHRPRPDGRRRVRPAQHPL